MGLTAPKESYSGKVYSITIGEEEREVTFGGENVLPFHVFEGTSPNRPLIAYEIQDVPPSDWPESLQKTWKDVLFGTITESEITLKGFDEIGRKVSVNAEF